MTPLPRTQRAIAQRAKEAQLRDPFGFEWHEYALAMDAATVQPFLRDGGTDWETAYPNVETVDRIAKCYLDLWLEKIESERDISVQRATMQYAAWKWLLGHPDSDTFPGSFASRHDGGWYQRVAYDYIKQQIESGEWDRLTAVAQEASHA